MTDAQAPETMTETKPGPPNPQAEGLDAPTPPGGPMRQDSTGEGPLTGGHDDDASASRANDKHAEESGGHTIPIEDEQPGPDHEPDHERDEALQEENAETSLDQPSGSGSGD